MGQRGGSSGRAAPLGELEADPRGRLARLLVAAERMEDDLDAQRAAHSTVALNAAGG